MSFKLQGQYNTAMVHTDNVNEETIGQIIQMCNIESLSESTIHIMPDCHKALNCVVGTALTYTDSIIPSMVGTDIGCGMLLCKIEKQEVSDLPFEKLNHFLKTDIAKVTSTLRGDSNLMKDLITPVDESILQSFATLGSGNHFIEMAEDVNYTYIVIHTGSRWLGSKVALYHENIAYELNNKKLRASEAHLMDTSMEDYLHDLTIAQKFASENRKNILYRMLKHLGLENSLVSYFESEHNYIDIEQRILHKGSCSAVKGEDVLIPINMRDGSILGVGLGNTAWNNSAPHGAGRLLTRSQAKDSLSLETFKHQMEDIWSACVNQSMISESPDAYKSLQEIQENVKDTIEIKGVIKPFYNFKNN